MPAARAASRTFSVPRTLASYIASRSCGGIPTMYCAAQWKTASQPRIASASAARSERSPRTSSASRSTSRRTSATTSSPRARSARVSRPPRNPVAPVTKTRTTSPHAVGDELRDLGRRRPDLDAARLERFLLPLRRPGGARDDRAGVAHRLAGRGRESGDVREHRLRHVLGDERGGLLLLVAADLADHDDQLRLRVLLELRQHVDERGPDHRIAADADDGRVAEPELGELVADLVGEDRKST